MAGVGGSKYERVEGAEEWSREEPWGDDWGEEGSTGSAEFEFGIEEDRRDKAWKDRFSEWVFPADVTREAQLWRLENFAVPLSYLMVGLFQGLASGVMTVYPIELGATEAQQTTIKVLRSLPASFKVFFGFFSDTVPLFGYRRKGYMLIGWLLSSFAMFSLLYLGTPSIPQLALLYFLFGLGFWFADVMADSLVAEKAKLEPEARRGQLQSTCYACRFFMLMVSVAFATYAYDSLGPRFMFWIMAILPLVLMLPAVLLLNEPRDIVVPSVKSQCTEIWNSVSSRSVWQPMGFIYIYNLLQIGNSAWTQFLYTALKFTPAMINSLMVVSYVLLYAGIMVYKHMMLGWSWRLIYVLTTLLNSIFSLLQLALLFGWNRRLGISDYLFALGDDAIAEFIGGIQFLPSTIMMVHLCPVGSEGASYAMFTTMGNSAMTVASSFSTLLLGIWDVSKTAFEEQRFMGMAKLTVLTTAIQTFGIAFVWLLPKGKDDLMALNIYPRSRIGGILFLTVIALGLIFSIADGLLNVLFPGWSGES